MAKSKLKLVTSNVRSEMLKSEWALDICKEIGDNMVAAAGGGYVAEVRYLEKRIAVRVFPNTPAAKSDNYKNNTLEKLRRQKF